MVGSACWRDFATFKTAVEDLLFEGGFNKIGRAEKKGSLAKERKQPLNSGNSTNTMHPTHGSVFKPFPRHCFIFASSGQRRDSFHFFPLILLFWSCMILRNRGRCDRLKRGGSDCIGFGTWNGCGTALH